ncbi:cupin domain-containing protein [Streptomyces sp. NPDC051217]|uniref:cupin domain-containing protein n=1 Tax=Streptomyces sp. NPDC051217 TaxID=3365644 RepID=UPI0037B0C120
MKRNLLVYPPGLPDRRVAADGERVTERSYTELALARLRNMCAALEPEGPAFGDAEAELLCAVTEPWGRHEIPTRLDYHSLASNDGAPIELSMGFQRGSGPELRATWEALGERPGAAGRQLAAREATRSLREYTGVCLERYATVEDLFMPRGSPPQWSAIHSVVWAAGRTPMFKVYLNPQARGAGEAPDLVAEAMRRLGLAKAWDKVDRHHDGALNGEGQELVYVALDLAATPEARVKVYLRHADADPAGLERAARVASRHRRGRVEEACHAASAPLSPKPPITTLTLRGAEDEPATSTLYFPLSPNVRHDAAGRAVVAAVFEEAGLDSGPCFRALDALAGDTAPELSHMLNYVGITGQERVTVFTSLEAHPVPLTWPYPRPPHVPTPYRGLGDPSTEGEAVETTNGPAHDDIVHIPGAGTYESKQGFPVFAGISSKTAGSRGLCMHLLTVPPGGKEVPHLHEDHESAIYVISGRAEGRYGQGLKKTITIEAGDFVYIPAGVPHQPANASTTENLVAIIARTDPNEQESVVVLPEPST